MCSDMAWKAALDAGKTPTHTGLTGTGDYTGDPSGCMYHKGAAKTAYYNTGYYQSPTSSNYVPVCVRTIEPTPEAVYSPKGTFDCPSGYSAYNERCNSDFPYLYSGASMNAYCTTRQDWAAAMSAPPNNNNWCTTDPAKISQPSGGLCSTDKCTTMNLKAAARLGFRPKRDHSPMEGNWASGAGPYGCSALITSTAA